MALLCPTICPYCGNAVTPTQLRAQSNPALQQEEDVPSAGLNLLSLFVPIAGWIMYFVFSDNTPIKAKSCNKWAWIGFGISAFFGIIEALLE